MKRVLKWVVPVDDQPHEIGGGPVVHVSMSMNSLLEVLVWTVEWDERSLAYPKREVKVVGTGHGFDESGIVVGTATEYAQESLLVWHVVRF